MIKTILVIAVLQLFMVLGSCSSDSGNDSIPVQEIKGEIKVDYAVNISPSLGYGFVVNNDNTVFFTEQYNQSGYYNIRLGKIDLTGKVTTLSNLDTNKFYNNRLCNSFSGDIVLFTYNLDYGNLLYRFGNSYNIPYPFYTMKPNGPSGGTVSLSSICNASIGTTESYFVFDYGVKSIKRIFVGSVNTDILIAGSEKKEIKDGVGLDASFSSISQMIFKNDILYVIDRDYGNFFSVRKIEYTAAGWKVSTLVSSTTDKYENIGIDSQNDLYVLLKDKGIYKLNSLNNTLSIYKDGIIKIDKPYRGDIDLKKVSFMDIKNDDLYIEELGYLRKISNFKTKFTAAEK